MSGVSPRLTFAIVAAFAASAIAVVALWIALDGDRAQAVPAERPSHFVSRTIATLARDDYVSAWDSLYPAHQKIAPRTEYVSCEMKTPLGWKLRSVRVVRVVDRMVRVPGASEDVAAKAVTLHLRVFEKLIGAEESFSHTFTAVPVGGEWSWILTPSQYERYSTHSCGA
jgi:hypothetical protein